MTKRQKQDGDQNNAPLEVLLEEKLKDYFDQLKKEQEERSVPEKMHVYDIDPKEANELNSVSAISAFSPKDSYWRHKVQHLRFDDCDNRGILYRPQIVKEMMKVIDGTFKKNRRSGIIMKGPHVIGKSHSLVNLGSFAAV